MTMIDHNDFDSFSLTYIAVDWEKSSKDLVFKDVHIATLFKAPAKDLDINWTAGKQIQVDVHKLRQSFKGSIEDWTKSYLKHFIDKAETFGKYMAEEYTKRFKDYI